MYLENTKFSIYNSIGKQYENVTQTFYHTQERVGRLNKNWLSNLRSWGILCFDSDFGTLHFLILQSFVFDSAKLLCKSLLARLHYCIALLFFCFFFCIFWFIQGHIFNFASMRLLFLKGSIFFLQGCIVAMLRFLILQGYIFCYYKITLFYFCNVTFLYSDARSCFSFCKVVFLF